MTDKELAMLIRKANSEGSGALLKLGWSLAHGIDGIPQRRDLAESIYQKLSNNGNSVAQASLAELFYMDTNAYTVIDEEKAEYWLKKSAHGGNSYATKLLIILYTEVTNFKKASSQGFLEILGELANKKDPLAMVVLGTIHCCDPKSRYVERYPDLISEYNPKKGFALIEEGVKLGELRWKDNEKAGCFFTDLFLYADIADAYHSETRKIYNPQERGRCYFDTNGAFIDAHKRKIYYRKKALEVANSWPGLPSDFILSHEISLDASQKELDAFLETMMISNGLLISADSIGQDPLSELTRALETDDEQIMMQVAIKRIKTDAEKAEFERLISALPVSLRKEAVAHHLKGAIAAYRYGDVMSI